MRIACSSRWKAGLGSSPSSSASTRRRELARAVLLRLTALGEGTEETRRRIDRDELTGIGPAGDVDVGIAGLSATAAVIAVLAVLALVQAVNAKAERDRAVSRRLAAEARRQLETDPELALLLAIKAYETAPNPDADLMLRQAVADARTTEVARLNLAGAQVVTAAISPDGRRIAVVPQSDTAPGEPVIGHSVLLWERAGGGWRRLSAPIVPASGRQRARAS